MYKKALLALFALFLSSCAATSVTDNEDSALESYNRAMFDFNQQVDKYVLKPVATGYKSVTNQFVRNRVTNFFNNLEEPAYTVNNLLQGEFKNSSVSVGRFVINSTLGLLGTFDVAAGWGLDNKKTSLDATLAKYCVPDGPFVILPFVGPSTPRHLVGWTGDAYMSPLYWALVNSETTKQTTIDWGAVWVKYVNLRAKNMDLIESLEKSSVDFYATTKSAFMQNRNKFVSFCKLKEEKEQTPSYDFDFEEDF